MRTKWILGTDHAGIATQTQVERKLLGRGDQPRGDRPRGVQPRRCGNGGRSTAARSSSSSSAWAPPRDYEHERFTLDEAYVGAVLKVFVALYEKGYVYRDNYMVNWDPGSRSAISDLEVEEREVTDTLYQIAYPLEDGSGEVVGRDRAPRDDARGHRDRGEPRRRAPPPPRRQDRDPAARRAPAADHRRRLRQDRLRHRLPEDHARATTPTTSRSAAATGCEEISVIGEDGLMTAGRGRALRRADGRGRARARRRRPARRGRHPPRGALHPRGALQPPLGRADRAADLAAVVHADGRAGGAGDRGRALRARADPPAVAVAAATSTGSRTSARGASAASCGGATSCRSGTAATRPTSASTRPRARAGSATPTSWTPGSARRCGRSRRSAGRRTRPSCARSTRPTCCSRRATSCSCGSRGW